MRRRSLRFRRRRWSSFDEAAQKEAFNRAYVEAINLISDQAKKTIEQLYGSFDKWLKLKIEAAVSSVKKTN